ncbi:MAG: MFS transporter [Treponema sp.]|jgi:PPP family 3-phenylpropionic acid transporter|nr:MFS transporter [Treponema sp.]
MKPAYLRLSSVSFSYWFGTAACAYFTVLLQKNGYSPAQVGIVNAVNSAVTIAATPFWGMTADKFRSIRNVILATMCVGIPLWMLIPLSLKIFAGPLALLFIIAPLGCFFRNPHPSLVDAYIVQRCGRDGLTYGYVRLWGSISYTIASMGFFFLLPVTGVEAAFYIYGAGCLPFLILMWNFRDPDAAAAAGQRKALTFRQMGFGRLFKNYYFITFLIFALFIYLPNTTSNAFMPYLMESVGGESARYGLITGFKALLEVPSLFLMRTLRKHFPLPVMLAGAAVFYSTEALLYANASSMTHIVFIQIFQGLGGGLLIGSSANYLYSLSPPELTSTAQTMNGALGAAAAIIGNLVGGVLIVLVGIRRFYFIISGALLFALIFFAFTLFFGIKILNKKLPAAR